MFVTEPIFTWYHGPSLSQNRLQSCCCLDCDFLSVDLTDLVREQIYISFWSLLCWHCNLSGNEHTVPFLMIRTGLSEGYQNRTTVEGHGNPVRHLVILHNKSKKGFNSLTNQFIYSFNVIQSTNSYCFWLYRIACYIFIRRLLLQPLRDLTYHLWLPRSQSTCSSKIIWILFWNLPPSDVPFCPLHLP